MPFFLLGSNIQFIFTISNLSISSLFPSKSWYLYENSIEYSLIALSFLSSYPLFILVMNGNISRIFKLFWLIHIWFCSSSNLNAFQTIIELFNRSVQNRLFPKTIIWIFSSSYSTCELFPVCVRIWFLKRSLSSFYARFTSPYKLACSSKPFIYSESTWVD